jgi:hypothetical protein
MDDYTAVAESLPAAPKDAPPGDWPIWPRPSALASSSNLISILSLIADK